MMRRYWNPMKSVQLSKLCALGFACLFLGCSQENAADVPETYTLGTKIYLTAEGSPNFPKYEGYGLMYEDEDRLMDISGTIYPPNSAAAVPKAMEALSVRIWEKSDEGSVPSLVLLCCRADLTLENVSVIQWDDTLQTLDFLKPSGERLYREVRQTPGTGTSIKVLLGFNAGSAENTLRAIAISSDQDVSQSAFQQFICEKRRDADLGPPDLSALRDKFLDRPYLLDLIANPC